MRRAGFDFGWLRGNEGNDTSISGHDGVGTTLNGSGVDYSADIAGVSVDLLAGTAIDGWGDADTLSGEGNDVLTGGLGADVIELGTSILGLGSNFDAVRYGSSADSRAAAMDRIVGFTQSGGDGFDRIGFENAAGTLFAGVTSTSIALGTRVSIQAANTLDDVIAQITFLAASTASALSVTKVDVGFGGAAGRYVVVNDTTAAFDAASDMLIAISMAPGSTTNLTAANFFLF